MNDYIIFGGGVSKNRGQVDAFHKLVKAEIM